MKRLSPYVQIMRPDNWFKNVFCVPGVVLAYVMSGRTPRPADLTGLALGFAAVCLAASANYILNEIIDAPWDREHPDKHARPIPSGLVKIPRAYALYGVVTAAAFALGLLANRPFLGALAVFWIMGVVYNVRPLRTKEVTYVDALSEAINNPIRLALGWWMVDPTTWPPLSILAGYWMLGAFFMALKRYAEYRHIGDPERAVRYRRSFLHTDEQRLMVSAVVYTNAFYLFLGVFIAKFRVELLLAVPFLSLFGAYYLRIALRPNSLVQYPEKLYREKKLMMMLAVTSLVSLMLLFVDMPFLHRWLRMQKPVRPVPMGQLERTAGQPRPPAPDAGETDPIR